MSRPAAPKVDAHAHGGVVEIFANIAREDGPNMLKPVDVLDLIKTLESAFYEAAAFNTGINAEREAHAS